MFLVYTTWTFSLPGVLPESTFAK